MKLLTLAKQLELNFIRSYSIDAASIVVIIAVLLPGAIAQCGELTVPEGFVVEQIAGAPLIHRPIFACLDDVGHLYVGESSGENLTRVQMLERKPHWITRLEDTDGDGVYDKATKFAENITLPQGCLWYQGSLFATCPPGIVKFTDTDGDGKADQQEVILTGFGFSGNACDTHGPFLSPSGRLYIVEGRHGHEFTDKHGVVFSKGKAGRIFSCMPNGDDVRVHGGGGFDNPVEVDFTGEGDCIGTANIVYRDRGDCLLHWVEGGVYPRDDQADAIAEFKWTGGLLGPVHDLGHVAVSGITRYRGSQFGTQFQQCWFYAEFNTHRVRYSQLKQVGSTFIADVQNFLHCDDGDYHPTDVLEDADGSLLVLNTGGWFQNGCPTSRIAKPEIYGTVHRIRKQGMAFSQQPRSGALPANNDLATTFRSVADRLNDDRPYVHEQTVQWLRKNVDISSNLQTLSPRVSIAAVLTGKDPQATQQVFAGLLRSTSETPHATEIAAGYLGDLPDWSQIAADQLPMATSLAQITLQHARDLVWQSPLSAVQSAELLRNLANAPLPVFRAGMEFAATRCVDRQTPVITTHNHSLQSFLSAIAARKLDRVAEHSLIFALIQLRQPAPLLKVLTGESAGLKKVALIALDQMNSSPLQRESVVPLLSVPDIELQAAALDVIARRPGWGAETLSVLKTWLEEPELTPDRASAVHSFLEAQLSDAAVQVLVVDVLTRPGTTQNVKHLFWDTIQKSTLAVWPAGFAQLPVIGLQDSDPQVQIAALKTIQQRKLSGSTADIKRLASDEQASVEVRSEAVLAWGRMDELLEESVFISLLSLLEASSASSNDKTQVGRALGGSLLTSDQLLKLAATLDHAGPLELPALIKAYGRSADGEVGESLIAALLKSGASMSVSADELAAILRKYPATVRTAADPLFKKLGVDAAAQEARLAELVPLLQGGNSAAGRDVFFGQKAACSSCHSVGSQGGKIGPHLTTIGASRTAQDLLEAIVFPSASFVNGYRTSIIATQDGRVLQGVISAETSETVTLRTQDLQELHLRRGDIEEQRESTTSIMPIGLDRQLTPQELQDLLAFLQSRK